MSTMVIWCLAYPFNNDTIKTLKRIIAVIASTYDGKIKFFTIDKK
jgi:hypothetical protein